MRGRGQSIGEYAIVLSLAAAAILAMETYLRRGVQANVKLMADQMLGLSSEELEPYELQAGCEDRSADEQTQCLGMEALTGDDLRLFEKLVEGTVQASSIRRASGVFVQERLAGLTPKTLDSGSSTSMGRTESVFVGEDEIPLGFTLRPDLMDGLLRQPGGPRGFGRRGAGSFDVVGPGGNRRNRGP